MSLIKSSQNGISSLCLAELTSTKYQNLTGDITTDYKNTINEYKLKLMTKESPVKITAPENQQYIDQILEFASRIPSVSLPSLNSDVEVPTFEKILSVKDDSKEIKSMINKINRKTQTYVCDHSKLEKLSITYGADALALRKNSALKVVDDFYKRLAEYCWKIEQKDKIGKVFKSYNFNININEVDEVIEQAINFSGQVMKFSSKYHNIHCPKCQKLKKEFEFAKEEIEQRRKELEEEKEAEIQRILAEASTNNSDVEELIQKYFPGMTRIPVMSIVKLWKTVKGSMITKKEIASMLEDTEKWRVTNTHNVLYANKL